jgi:hypothetical protein
MNCWVSLRVQRAAHTLQKFTPMEMFNLLETNNFHVISSLWPVGFWSDHSSTQRCRTCRGDFPGYALAEVDEPGWPPTRLLPSQPCLVLPQNLIGEVVKITPQRSSTQEFFPHGFTPSTACRYSA